MFAKDFCVKQNRKRKVTGELPGGEQCKVSRAQTTPLRCVTARGIPHTIRPPVTRRLQRKIFLDGKIVEANERMLEQFVPGVMTAKGVFETMRVYDGKIFLLDKHINRLQRGLKALEIVNNYTKKEIRHSVTETLRVNRLRNARMRLMVWQKHHQFHVAVIARPYKAPAFSQYSKGYKVLIYSRKMTKPRVSCDVKAIDYRFFQKAHEEAARQGYDEAVVLNRNNEIVEGARTNIFLCKQGVLYAPALRSGGLNGITRQVVLKLAKEAGIKIRLKILGVEDFYQADEAFLTNSLLEVIPASQMNREKIGNGCAGPVTEKIMKRYRQNVKAVIC